MEVGLKFCLLQFGKLQKLQLPSGTKGSIVLDLQIMLWTVLTIFASKRKQLKKLSVAPYEMTSMDE